MSKRLLFVGFWLCVTVLDAIAGQWTCDSAGGLLTHDTAGWILNVSTSGTNLTVTGVNTAPATASALPLADPLPGFAITGIGYNAFNGCYNLTGVTIPDSVTNIGVCAFLNCSLTNVTIPDAVNHIGLSAFGACFSLTSIDVASENTQYAGLDGILYTRGLTELIQCPGGKTGTVTIPDSVARIGDYAFAWCLSLTGVTIPDSVTSIEDDAFWNCALANVTIPFGVTHIGFQAFGACNSLTSIDVASENTQYAGLDGILYSRGLTELIQCPGGKTGTVTIPDSVTSIGDFAFYLCYNLTGVTIPDSVASIGDYVFGYCNSLTGVMIGNGLTRIGYSAFCRCGSLTQLVMPASLSEIGYGAFSSCNALNSVLYEGPYPARQVQEYLYGNDNVVTSYVYTAHVGSWDPYVVEGPLAEGSAVWQGRPIRPLPNPAAGITVTLDGCGGAFDGPVTRTAYYGTAYGALPVPHVREGYRFLGWGSGPNGGIRITSDAIVSCARDHTLYAWWYKNGQWTYDDSQGLLTHDSSGWVLRVSRDGTNLTVTGVSVVPLTPVYYELTDPIPGFSLVGIGPNAFFNAGYLRGVTIPDSVISIGDYAFYGCSNLTGVTIPDSVTSIGDYAFAWCYNLTGVTIPDSVISIGYGALRGCSSLTSIDVASENKQFAGLDGILYTRGLTELIQCPGGKTGTVTIPDSVTSIGDDAFYGCSNLTGVTIPDSVASIGDDVFGYCNSLTGVMIGNGVTRIGSYAFEGCGSLTQLVLPASLSEIGYYAFYSCSALNTVLFEGAYPARLAQGTLYEENNVVTSYVYTAHAGSWDPYVVEGPLAEGSAVWQGRPIRPLPNPAANITVTFDKRGGSFAGPTAKTVHYGQSYGTLPVPTRAGHRFDGWWTGINGVGLSVTPASAVSCARSHALHAKWLVDVTAEASAALGTTNLVWYTQEAPADWRADAETTYDEDGSMRSADRGTGIPSALRSTLTGPGLLQFRWRTASEDRERTLNFCVDGAERVPSLSGGSGWQKVTVSIPAGEHTVEWVYDSTSGHGISDGPCAGWLDQVVWPAVAHTPEEHFWLWESGLFGRSWVPENLVSARDGFGARIQDNPADMAARVYRAVATLALLSENPEIRDLTESFGLTLDTNLFSSAVAFTGTAAPSANEAVDRTAAQFLPALDAALADLESVPSDWDGTVELTADATGFDETVYVDLADVLLAKSYLYAARAAIQLAQAYDLTVDYAKTNVTQTVIAPFELLLIANPFNDAGFTAWESVPALLFGSRGCLEHGSLARSDTQALLLLRTGDGVAVDYVYARLTDENGTTIGFNLSVGDISENQVTNVVGYEWVSQIDQEIEVAYSVLKSGGHLLIARDVAWGPELVKVVEASAYVDGFNVAENGYTDDWADWTAMTRVQPASRFLEDHPACMQTVRDAAKLPFAKESLRAALQAAQAADSSITGRTDGAWHAIEFAPDQTNVLAEVRQKLSETLASLDAPRSLLFCHTNVEEVVNGYWEEIYDPGWDEYMWQFIVTSVETQRTEIVNQTERVHIGALFAPPYLTRAMLPRFADGNEPVLGSFPDPTFGGVLPAWDEQQLETNLLGRVPVMRERAFQMGGQWFHTGGYALWAFMGGEGWGDMAQGGALNRCGKVSWLETVVTGPGTLDFSWALTEAIDRESVLTVFVDGVRQPGGEIWGETAWVPRQIEIPEGRHTVRWSYELDYAGAEAPDAEASYGWLTDASWTPDSVQSDTTVTTPVAVPHSWLNGYPGLFGAEADYERVALDDQDGDGHPTWSEFVAGTDPVSPMSAFTALIEQGPAGLMIGWTPDLTPARDYQVEGKSDLRDAAWGPTNAATRFFRVKVTLP